MITAPDVVWETGPELINPGRAAFSVDRVYRYRLERIWDAAWPAITWIMLNPSKADASVDDPTIRKITRFARRWHAGGVVVVNLFAYRSTEPAGLRPVADPVGPLNDWFIREAGSQPTVLVAAWGTHGALHGRGAEVTRLVTGAGAAMLCLGVNDGGQPKHPLYVREVTPLRPYTAAS